MTITCDVQPGLSELIPV